MRRWIPEYEGLYEIDTDGFIYKHYRSGEIKQSNPIQNVAGYLTVNLSKNSKAKIFVVHRLVAQLFIPNPDDLPIVDHIDEDKTNNAVTNLRWCTAKQNTEYYNTKDGRAHHIALGKARKDKLKAYEQLLQLKAKEISNLRRELDKQQKLVEEKEKKIQSLLQDVEATKQQVAEKISLLREETDRKYEGYIDTTGVKFKSVSDMVELVGKPITVNGILFKSCGAAAAYIVKQEAADGVIKQVATVSKELRRYLQGLRPAWRMFGKYEIR